MANLSDEIIIFWYCLILIGIYLQDNVFVLYYIRFKMTSGGYPFEGRTVFTLFESIGKGEYTIPDTLKNENELKNLING